MQPQQMQPGMMQMQPMQSDKNWVAVLLLGLLGIFGIAGIDRFYTGSILLGVLKLITFGGLRYLDDHRRDLGRYRQLQRRKWQCCRGQLNTNRKGVNSTCLKTV